MEVGQDMRKLIVAVSVVVAAQVLGNASATAGPWEDGMAAYNRGDYVPAIRLFRPLAAAGNARAQSVLGVMYREGQGVAKSVPRGSAWLLRGATRRRKRNCRTFRVPCRRTSFRKPAR